MLQRLHISNYAIIDELELHFPKGLNIITGETGAGKSILIGALGLVLGDRADSFVLQDASRKCIAEASFKLDNKSQVFALLQKHDLDELPELIIRREIAASGKSRAFINDTPVTLAQLKEISAQLADLHQQFDTLELSDKKFQSDILDSFAGNMQHLHLLRIAYENYSGKLHELTTLEKRQAEAIREKDYLQFLFDELDASAWKENELELLDEELALLSNAENIKLTLVSVTSDLEDGEQPIISRLKVIAQQLSAIEGLPASVASLIERLQAATIEIRDINDSINQIEKNITPDPARMQVINDRTGEGYTQLKKHNLYTTADLLALKEELSNKLEGFSTTEAGIAALKKDIFTVEKDCLDMAQKIHKKRMASKDVFAAEVNGLLHTIGMPSAALQINITEKKLSENGIDDISFMFDANARGKFEPLHKVASGGELSRLMLCIKSLVAGKIELPTLIFDEIDTGISGEAAKQVGKIMKAMSSRHQLIVISHQPQVAARADMHLYVFKENNGTGIQTKVVTLTVEERINNIAQMIGGEKPTAAALENARELVIG